MAVYLLVKTFTTKWQSLRYSKHSSQNGSLSATENIPIEQSLFYSKPSSQDGSISVIHNVQKWQSLCYYKHPQDGSLSATQNIHHKMAVPLILKKFITKWPSLWYSKHAQDDSLSVTQKNAQDGSPCDTTFKTRQFLLYSKHSFQNGSLSDTQNINHKMTVSLLPKTYTRWGCLCYSEYSSLVFLNGYPHRFSM